MLIMIPSRARADQKIHTIDTLPDSAKAKLVVGKEDYKAYKKRFGKKRLFVTEAVGIGPVRQELVEHAASGARDLLMFDDDLRFFKRRKDEPTKLKQASEKDIAKMLALAEKKLRKFSHIGITAREGANRNTDKFIKNTRILRALGFNARTLMKEGIRFDRTPVMEDFDVALQLLRKGYPSCTINHYAQDQGTSNAPGGCSEYRTMDVQAQGANMLKKMHPDYVTVVEKQTKTAWNGQERLDVRIQWKKAYKGDVR